MVIVDKIMKEGIVGVMTTHAANSLSTDSAAAATAMANGCKAKIGALGVCADGTIAVSAMEIARRRGMKLGLGHQFDDLRRQPGGVCLPCAEPQRLPGDIAALLGNGAGRSTGRWYWINFCPRANPAANAPMTPT